MKHLTFISDRKLKRWTNTLWLQFSCSYTQTNSILPMEKKSIYPFGQELTILDSLIISTGWFTDLWIHFSVSQRWIYQTYLFTFRVNYFTFGQQEKTKSGNMFTELLDLKFTCKRCEKIWKILGLLDFLQAFPKMK